MRRADDQRSLFADAIEIPRWLERDRETRYADRLARALATVINVIDPHAIVLGGGLSNLAHLYTEVPARWGAYVFSDAVATKLVRARHGDSSGVRGAAWLWPPR